LPGNARHSATRDACLNNTTRVENTDSKPIISSFAPPWLSAVCIKGTSKSYENLPSVKHYIQDSTRNQVNDSEIRENLAAFVAQDDYPIPAVSDREGYYKDDDFGWWLSGLKDYIAIKRTLIRYGPALNSGDSTFELGCASGRVLRHFACQQPAVTVWGADIQLRHVEWIRKFLPEKIRVFQNTVFPQLPLESNSQKLVYAFSVFTHIDDFELAWLAEVRRVLAPGGIAYLTIHSERTWENMNPEWPLWKGLIRHKDHIVDYDVSTELFKAPMPLPKTVFCWTTAQTYNTQVFHSDDYIRTAWGRFLALKDIIAAGYDYQDVVVLQKE
jgi:ubiquinone/menaquinone biosynthesis C-methylase UbiE